MVHTDNPATIYRFIPAGAGNTWPINGITIYDNRSSPQARGTRRGTPRTPAACRFIPAGAGNTSTVCRAPCPPAVHPRRRGEHRLQRGDGSGGHGSSPQARGTRQRRSSTKQNGRFIPAGAGNTTSIMPAGDHRRFIPAGAGNTSERRRGRAMQPVHPRRRGEHAVGGGPGCCRAGSSPQARGTRARWCGRRWLRRFIPAGAGNTTRKRAPTGGRAVHPRRRGEHAGADHVDRAAHRFIPAGAGNTVHFQLLCGLPRFIPAGAGNT